MRSLLTLTALLAAAATPALAQTYPQAGRPYGAYPGGVPAAIADQHRYEMDRLRNQAAEREALLETLPGQPAASFETLVQRLRPQPVVQAGQPEPAREQVAALLREVLELEVLDEQAQFFEVGGSSLKAVLLCARVHQLWGTQVPAHLVFLNPRLEDLLNVLSRYRHANA